MKLKMFAAIVALSVMATMAFGQNTTNTPDYGKIADAFQVLSTEFRKLATTTPPPPPQPAGPQIPILTDARIAALKAMQAANTVDWQKLKTAADSPTPLWDDNGRFSAIVYRVTGDKSYAAKAYTLLMATVNNTSAITPDNVREYLIEFPLIYYWIKDALTVDQQGAFSTAIQAWANLAVKTRGFSAGDSDQCLCQFMGLAILDKLGIGPGYLNTTSSGPLVLPIGGLTPTAADLTSARNAIAYYVTVNAKGGTWFESTEYNSNTVVLLLMGWMALQDLYGHDYFPEIAAWVPSACQAALTSFTPDLKARVEWGDIQATNQLDLYREIPRLTALQAAAVRVGATTEAAKLADLLNKFPPITTASAVRGRYFYFIDRSIQAMTYYDGKSSLANYSPGVGLYSRLDGSSLAEVFSPSNTLCDHVNGFVGHIKLYSNDEWVLGSPSTYGGIANNAIGQNAPLVSGLSAMDSRGPVNCITTSDYTYFVGHTSGTYYGSWKAWVAPTFCNELTRTLFYLPKQNTVVICTRFNSIDPASAISDGNMAVYYQPERDAIAAASGPGQRHQENWHTPVAPTITSTVSNGVKLSWATAGGQQMEITSYSPQGPLTTELHNESEFLANAPGKQVRVHPTDNQQFRTMLTCIRANPSTNTPTPIQSTGAAGFSIDGVTVFFGVDQTSRLLDPSKVATSGATYLVGCTGDAEVVVKP